MASLRDVADRAGVSLATASRVVSGSSAVRPETKERVEGAMRDLLYVPPGRVEPSAAIGLFVPDFSNPIFAALAEAMEMHAARSGLATILCNTHGSAGRERDYVRMLLERGVEGMLFISAEITDVRGRHSHYAKLLERGARLVFVNGGSEELDVTSVGVDERAAGRIATEHLIELGHERIGFVAGDEYALPTREKALGHGDALRAAKLTDGLVAHSSFTVGGGREALRALLAKPEAERPTAVICSSDLMAIGALQESAALRPEGARGAFDRRLRRHRRRDVDESTAHDGRAADRRDRTHGRRGAVGSGREAVRATAELRLPTSASSRRHDGSTVERGRDVVEVLEALERHAEPVQVGREPVASEDPVRCLRDAAVGEAVADVGEAVETRDVGALARLAADVTDCLRTEDRDPAVGPWIEPVRHEPRVDPIALEERLDELVEAHRDDERIAVGDELRESGAQRHRRKQERDDVVERRGDRGHLDRDDVSAASCDGRSRSPSR